MSLFTIDVTFDDILGGTPADNCACPIALAALRVLPFLSILAIGPHTFFPYGIGGGGIKLPQAATDFINRFDNGERVDPFSFDINIPDELIPAEVAQ